MTRLRVYREEEELREEPAIPFSRPHSGQESVVPASQSHSCWEERWTQDLSPGQSPAPRCQKSCRSVVAQWDLASRCEGGVSWGEGTQLIPIPSFLCLLFQAFLLGPSYQGQRLWKRLS